MISLKNIMTGMDWNGRKVELGKVYSNPYANAFKPLKEGLTIRDINNPRQSFEDVFITNGYIDIVKSDFIIKNKELHGDKMIVFETPVTYQVDTKEDFDFIEYKYKLTYE